MRAGPEFDAFFEAEYRPLRRLAFLLTRDWGEAEDLVQETLVRTYRAWARIQDRENPAAYARAVLINRHRSLLRRAMVEARHLRARATAEAAEAATPADAADVERLDARRALASLPLRYREVLVLRYFEDRPEAEIAQIIGCPIGTVKSLIHRGLARLRRGMELDETPASEPALEGGAAG